MIEVGARALLMQSATGVGAHGGRRGWPRDARHNGGGRCNEGGGDGHQLDRVGIGMRGSMAMWRPGVGEEPLNTNFQIQSKI
jgi:hypothetical protein